MGRKYNSPPIVEALCEFQFVPSQPWDMTIPGLFYEKINNEFPVKREKMALGIGFHPKEGGIEQRVETSQRMQYLRSDKTALVQIGRDLLTVNHLEPYPTWQTFKPLIINNFKLYKEVANPKGFKLIGLRYINRIVFDEDRVELTEYINYYPFIPANLPQTHEKFQTKVDIPYEKGRDHLLLTLSSTTSKKAEGSAVILDIGYVMSRPEKISFQEVPKWIEKAHTLVENAFEACITDKSRDLFMRKK